MDPESFKAVTPDGKMSVEAEFRPDGEEVICFGKVILDGHKHPLEEIETKDSNVFLKWMRTQMIEVMRRSGPASS